ncbi:MAG: apolipoprotein N-acyltransferase [Bacteroidota bacterium]|nr:apolipoprotein N-acyltransferase [Bacteroidota bacterium]
MNAFSSGGNLNPDPDGRLRRFRIINACLCGILLGAAFPPMPAGITAFIALVPLLFLIESVDSAGSLFRYAYLAFLVFNVATVWWISGWWGDDPWLKTAGVAVNLVHPLLFIIPVFAYWVLRKRFGLRTGLVLLPFIWTAFEFAAHLPELSFPWLLLGNTQTSDIIRIQFIRFTGVFGASFWIVTVNVLCFIAFRSLLRGRKKDRRRILAAGIGVFALFLAPEIDGVFQLRESPTGSRLRVGIAQPDIDPYEKWAPGETPMGKLNGLLRLYDSIAAEAKPALVLLPETAIPFYIRQPSFRAEWERLKGHVDSVGIPLLTGFPDIRWYEHDAPRSARATPDGYRYLSFNSSMLVLPADPTVQIYHKSRLTPISERIPYLDAFPFLQDALTWGVGISNWGLGNDTTVFTLEGPSHARLWAMICYETLYPSFVAGFVRRGANMLCVITNDGWFGHSSGPYQLKQYAVLRAIENRRPVARCANNGISCFIDAYGRVSHETAFGTRGWIAEDVCLRTDRTFYTEHGDWFALGCTIISLAVLIAALFGRRKASP